MNRATVAVFCVLFLVQVAHAAPPDDKPAARTEPPKHAAQHPPQERDDPDYLLRRQEYIMRRRGMPFPANKPNARTLAIREMEAQELKRYGRRAETQYLPANRTTLLNTTTWTAVGPAPIPNGGVNAIFSGDPMPSGDVPVNGRVNTIAIHPTNPNIVYIGASTGGVYRTLDGGTTWTPLLDGALTLAIGSIAIDPLNPSTIVVGTGDGDGGELGGVGLYKITNADGTTPVVSRPYNSDGGTGDVFTGAAITRVLISPLDDNIVFVSTTYPFTPHLQVTRPVRGLFRSTNFMSASPVFTQIPLTTANGGNRRVTDIVFDPNNANNVIANVGGNANVNGVPDGGLYLVANAAGASPTVTQTLNIDGVLNVRFAANKVGSAATILAATEEANGCTNSNAGALRRSIDGGQTWSSPLAAQPLLGFCGTQCWYDLGVAIDPSNANHILVGGSYDEYLGNGPCIPSGELQSTDGGTSFNRVGSAVHPDTHAFAFAPSNPSIVYAGDDGGIFKSTDGGTTWTSVNTSGFSATLFVAFTSHPLDRFITIGGTQDNGTNLIGANGLWRNVDGGDGGYAEIDRNAGDTFPAFMYHTFYNQPGFMGYARVTTLADALNGGWFDFGSGGYGAANGFGNDPNVQFYAPMALGPGNPNPLYFGSDRLYRSTDTGLTMSVVSQAPVLSGGHSITTIAISPQDDNVRVVGLSNGSVFATTTGSTTMTDITGSLPAQYASRVVIDPNSKTTAYVVYAGYGLAAGQHVWKNSNIAGGAANWVASGSGIPDVPVDSIVIDPLNSNNVYVGTDIGVYSSTDAGNSWAPFGTGMPRVPVFDLDIQSPSRVLRAATYGRGIFEIQIGGSQYPALSIGTVTVTPTSGNNNGVLEPGENAAITVQVTNHGVVMASGVTVSITTTTPGVTILTPAVTLPNLGPGAVGGNSTPLTFVVAYGAICGTPLSFTITASATGAPSVSQPLRVTLGGPAGTPATFAYSGAVLPIPDGDIGGANGTVSVSGISTSVAKVTVTIGGSACTTAPGATTVGIDHTWVGELQLYLISPSGTKVPLVLNSAGGGVNMCGTTFDDAASVAFSTLRQSDNPYTNTYRPYSPLSTFVGEPANGTWTLKVVDSYADGSYYTGHLRAFSITITPAACAAVLAAPQHLRASANGVTGADLTWDAVAGADHYDIFRTTNIASGFTIVPLTPGTNSFSDSGLTAGATYLYKVRASSITGGTSDYSALDAVTLVAFTDDPLVARSTRVKLAHVNELRAAVNAMRAAANLPAATFTDPTLTTATVIKAIHIGELRTALLAARNALGLPSVFTDDPLTAGTPVKAVHVQEIRDLTK